MITLVLFIASIALAALGLVSALRGGIATAFGNAAGPPVFGAAFFMGLSLIAMFYAASGSF